MLVPLLILQPPLSVNWLCQNIFMAISPSVALSLLVSGSCTSLAANIRQWAKQGGLHPFFTWGKHKVPNPGMGGADELLMSTRLFSQTNTPRSQFPRWILSSDSAVLPGPGSGIIYWWVSGEQPATPIRGDPQCLDIRWKTRFGCNTYNWGEE